jgi:leucine-zipper of insertion element IS481
METNALEERFRFVCDFESVVDRALRALRSDAAYRYKWIARSREPGASRLEDRSHAPLRCPHRTSPRIVALILSARKEYAWGAKKLLHPWSRP